MNSFMTGDTSMAVELTRDEPRTTRADGIPAQAAVKTLARGQSGKD
jgi:hypothetical protein